jgi:hypothetical protein
MLLTQLLTPCRSYSLRRMGRTGIVWGTHCTKPHSSLRVTTPYVRMSVVKVRTRLQAGKLRTELSPSRVRIRLEKFIDNAVEVHQAGILT